MKQRVHYVEAADHVQLAWAETGRGPPLGKAATWLTHLQYDRESPVWAHWVRFLGGHYRYIRYDERGCGMSDWNAGDLTPPRWVEDRRRWLTRPASIARSRCSASARSTAPR